MIFNVYKIVNIQIYHIDISHECIVFVIKPCIYFLNQCYKCILWSSFFLACCSGEFEWHTVMLLYTIKSISRGQHKCVWIKAVFICFDLFPLPCRWIFHKWYWCKISVLELKHTHNMSSQKKILFVLCDLLFVTSEIYRYMYFTFHHFI